MLHRFAHVMTSLFQLLESFLTNHWSCFTLSANFTKWSNTLKQFVVNLPTNCLSIFDHFVGLAIKGLKICLPICIRDLLDFIFWSGISQNLMVHLELGLNAMLFITRFGNDIFRIMCANFRIALPISLFIDF